jgi:hypothetical protein
MMHSNIHNAQEQIAALRDALVKGGPAEIEQCLPGLEAAARVLRNSEPAPGTRADLEGLRNELSRAARLIQHGESLWRGWARILGSAAGYTAGGEPAPLSAPSQLSVRG